MKKFITTKACAVPLPLKDIDTDMIIPAQYLTRTSSNGYGDCLFRGLRDNDKNFPLNLDKYRNAKFLVVDENFGCGSSREHAVWALRDAGFIAIIGKSFADIFSANAGNNGFLLIKLDSEKVDKLVNYLKEKNLPVTVNLENQSVECGELGFNFEFDPFRKHCILNGLDMLDYIFEKKAEIEAFSNKRKDNLFFTQ